MIARLRGGTPVSATCAASAAAMPVKPSRNTITTMRIAKPSTSILCSVTSLSDLRERRRSEGADHRTRERADPAEQDDQQRVGRLVPADQLGVT